jgi:transposase
MIQITAQMRVLVAVEPVDFRKRIDGLAALCRSVLLSEPFSGSVFVFRSRGGKALRVLAYDGQGFWLCEKRLSVGRFRFWPRSENGDPSRTLAAHEVQVLLSAGDPDGTRAAPPWRPVAYSAVGG